MKQWKRRCEKCNEFFEKDIGSRSKLCKDCWMTQKKIQGKKNRRVGKEFEIRVRKDLIEKGWTVCRFDNNVDLDKKEIIQAKGKFNLFKKVMSMSAGFPDFAAFKFNRDIFKLPESATQAEAELFFNQIKTLSKNSPVVISSNISVFPEFEVIGVECKINGILEKIEKEKIKFFKDNKTFGKILLAKKVNRKIEYIEL